MLGAVNEFGVGAKLELPVVVFVGFVVVSSSFGSFSVLKISPPTVHLYTFSPSLSVVAGTVTVPASSK